MVFYDRYGKPTAYTEDGEYIYLFTGEPVAYLYSDAVYGYSGRQFGWFQNGWVRDLNGNCAFFTENATGFGPLKPMKQLCPLKSLKQLRPLKGLRELKRLRPLDSLSWSALSGKQYFAQ